MPDQTSEAPDEHVFGADDAPVTVLEYGDYECPYCAAAAPVLRQLVEGAAGQVRLVFRNFPLFEVHPHALTAALAAESTVTTPSEMLRLNTSIAAVPFAQQNRLADADLRRYAEHVGSDPDLATGEAAQQFAPKVQRDYAAGIDAGVAGTPTLFIDGIRYDGRPELAALQRAARSSAQRRGPR